MSEQENHPFYGEEILRSRQQAYIQTLLRKYKDVPANEELKKQIWEELQREKHLGRVSIPFKVVLRKDPCRVHPDYIEVILDTKV